MKVKDMHKMRMQAAQYKKNPRRALTPLAKEIEIRREAIIRGILGNTKTIVERQLEIASLPVSEEGKANDVVLKATNSLLDRVFGKPKESIDLTGQVNFSLRALSKRADELEEDERNLPDPEDDDDIIHEAIIIGE